MQFWGMGTGTLMRDIVLDYVERLADDEAVLVIDKTGLRCPALVRAIDIRKEAQE
ncbi:hypothetical protein ABIB81_007668 [Bradyrhizobium sp. I1.7.5]